jgi:hypothetical protein
MTFADGLYRELLERGVHYFVPQSEWGAREPFVAALPDRLRIEEKPDGVCFEWLGYRRVLRGLFTESQLRMLRRIGNVLQARYDLLMDSARAVENFHLFRGLPEDRYVSAYLDPGPYRNLDALTGAGDRITEAIEVLRISSSTTYENRRIETGVLLFGPHEDPCHLPPALPEGALRYASDLTVSRSFHRLCDGLQTVALVDREGWLVEIVDVAEWARPYAEYTLPAPTASRFEAHARSTMCGGHVCLVLTPNGEVKIFAEGGEAFRFLDGRWHLTDSVERYGIFEQAVGSALAERLFRTALNLAEDRRGSLFVVLRDGADASKLIRPGDLLNAPVSDGPGRKGQFHYLLRGSRVLDLPASVLEGVARIDGAIVLDRDSQVLTFGAILLASADDAQAVDGGRTTAALAASRYGDVLKVSEDGIVSFYRNGRCVWEI